MDRTRQWAFPDATVLLCLIALVAWICTHWLTAGSFEVVGEGQARTLVAGSFQYAEGSAAPPLFAEGGEIGLLNLLFEGLVSGSKWGSAVGIAAFLLVVGGAFGIIMATGSLDRGIHAAIGAMRRYQDLMLPGLFALFSLAGAVFGMGEEAIAFCLVLVPMMVRMGYDSLTAVACCYVATQVGFATSWMNPFSVAIAQGIAGVPLLSGAELRMGVWTLFTLIGMVFVWHHGRKVRQSPERSPSFHSDARWRDALDGDAEHAQMTHLDRLNLVLLLAGMVWITWGVVSQGYYIPELAAQFFALSLAIGLVSRLGGRFDSLNELSNHFVHGAASLIPAVIVVALAKGVVLLLGGDDPSSPSLLNTLLYSVGNAFGDLGAYAAATLMFWFQAGFNLLVSSGSGQAALTMPMMAPLADLLGLSRQIAVLAFQLGDGLTNIVIPTSASLVGCLGVARVSWGCWLTYIWRLMLLWLTLATAAVMVAVMVGYV